MSAFKSNQIRHQHVLDSSRIQKYLLCCKPKLMTERLNVWLLFFSESYVLLLQLIRHFRNKKKLRRVNFCKDFWECYYKNGKNSWRCVLSNITRNNCKTHFNPSSLLVSWLRSTNTFPISFYYRENQAWFSKKGVMASAVPCISVSS